MLLYHYVIVNCSFFSCTGALPRNLDVFETLTQNPKTQEKVSLYRNIYDFEDLHDSLEKAKIVAIVGGGFLGSELACALARKGLWKLF